MFSLILELLFTFCLLLAITPIIKNTFSKEVILDANLNTDNTITIFKRNIRFAIIKRIKILPVIIWLLVFVMLLNTCFFIGKLNFINEKRTLALNNIEIVSPYISDMEYKMLKSKFYSIETKEQYDMLLKDLVSISSSNSIKLKK